MESLKKRESYIYRRTEQLQQWDCVIERMKARAIKAKDQSKIDLLHHIVQIQVKRVRIAVNLKNLKETKNEIWDDMKSDIEIKWRELRNAILKAPIISK